MSYLKYVLNKPAVAPCSSLNGIVQTLDKAQYKTFAQKNSLGVPVQGVKFTDPLKLIYMDKGNVSTEWNIFRFMLPEINKPLGLRPGEYVTLKLPDLEDFRSYRPVSSIHDNGFLDLLVKVFSTDYSQRSIGEFTQRLDALKEGDPVYLTEVAGSMWYEGRGKFAICTEDEGIKEKIAKKVGLISEGTSITAMFQFLQAAEEDPVDLTAFSLVPLYGNPTDALLEDDLLRMQENGKISYFPVVESPDEMWTHGEGKISEALIESFMPEPDDPEGLILLSGTNQMTNDWIEILDKLGYKKEQYQIL